MNVNQNENDIISDTDIEKLTGYKIPSRQCDCLRNAGIFFITRRDGRPRTTWRHFNDPLKHRALLSPASEPDWEAME